VSPETLLARRQLRAALNREIRRRLTPREEQCLKLYVVHGWSCSQIGTRVGVCRERVAQCVRKALRKLREGRSLYPLARACGWMPRRGEWRWGRWEPERETASAIRKLAATRTPDEELLAQAAKGQAILGEMLRPL